MQLKMFDETILEEAELVADSPKRAFYKLRLVLENGKYSVEKESGCNGKVLDRRKWEQPDWGVAEKFFNRKLAAKIRPGRKGPRHYYIPELLREAG